MSVKPVSEYATEGMVVTCTECGKQIGRMPYRKKQLGEHWRVFCLDSECLKHWEIRELQRRLNVARTIG